jgi:hypothetical protein
MQSIDRHVGGEGKHQTNYRGVPLYFCEPQSTADADILDLAIGWQQCSRIEVSDHIIVARQLSSNICKFFNTSAPKNHLWNGRRKLDV